MQLINKLILLFALIFSHHIKANNAKWNIYSTTNLSRISNQQGLKVISAAMEIWDNVLVDSQTPTLHYTTQSNKFSGELKESSGHPYISIFEHETKNIYYHFLDRPNSAETIKFQKEHYAKSVSLFAKKNMPATKIPVVANGWNRSSLAILDEVEVLYHQILTEWEKVQKKHQSLSATQFITKIISHNEITVSKRGLGSAEINAIDGIPFVRIAHAASELSFVIILNRQINTHSAHFKQYIARQHIDAGAERNDNQSGRDVITITLSENHEKKSLKNIGPAHFKSYMRPTPYLWDWTKQYWLATKQKVSLSSFKFGLINGILQGLVTYTLANTINYITGDIVLNTVSPALFTAMWGGFFGIYSSAYKNWTKRGPKWFRSIKEMANGIIFQFVLTIFINPAGLSSLNLNSMQGLIENTRILTSSYISAAAKTNWKSIVYAREAANLNHGYYKKTSFKKNHVEFQFAYMPAFITRFLDRSNLGIDRIYPVGGLFLLGAIPISQKVSLNWINSIAKDSSNSEVKKLAKEAQRGWDFIMLLIKDRHLNYLILKKYLQKLRYSKDHYNRIQKLLAKEYPDYYTHAQENIDTQNKISSKAASFKIPVKQQINKQNDKVLVRKPVNHKCLDYISPFLLLNFFNKS